MTSKNIINNLQPIELLSPAGDIDSLRAAVHNGADAVYLGLEKFNARINAKNFTEKNITSVIEYCHNNNVKVYITLNTLIKNSELKDYFRIIDILKQAKADAIIIQDTFFCDMIKVHYPDLKIHISTQGFMTNLSSVPGSSDRVVLPRETKFEEIKRFAEKYDTEIFVHGALCVSFSGECLFSSIIGGRSGNRGCCAQTCRRRYNNKYEISTMDLCLIEKLPEILESGVKSLKIEGRMRGAKYVAITTRIYKKYIDLYLNLKKQDKADDFKIEEHDLKELKLAFNREFTNGLGFTDNIIDTKKSMNRGLYLGTVKDGNVKLKESLKIGDGISIWLKDEVIGKELTRILIEGKDVESAKIDDVVELELDNIPDRTSIYKTFSVDTTYELGSEVTLIEKEIDPTDELKKIDSEINSTLRKQKIHKNADDKEMIIVKVYNKKDLILADKSKADIIYYAIENDDIEELKKLKVQVKNSKLFFYTKKNLTEAELDKAINKINLLSPDGLLITNKGFITRLDELKNTNEKIKLHADYTFNTFNDLDIEYLSKYNIIPIISPELSFDDLRYINNKKFISLVHGDLTLMTIKEKLKAPELIDEDNRHFRVREKLGDNGIHEYSEILNYKEIGLFNKIKKLQDIGIRYFLIDTKKDMDNTIRIYRKILNDKDNEFDDSKIRKGFTTGHFERSVI